jgi:hypothetical protein
MDRVKFNKLVVTEKGSWLEDAKRRKRWRWFNRIMLKPKIKYYRFKRMLFKK